MKKIIVLVLIILAVGFFWFKGRDTTAPNDGAFLPPPPAASQNNATEGTLTTLPPPDTIKEIAVLGSNFAFTPGTIEVKRGNTVKITFQSAVGFHDLTLDEFNIATKQLNAGESETVEFVADKTGTFEYYCSVGNHRALGMKGTLIVK